ncbi:MAG TPA: ribonuclease Z [Syntrophorhabdaceae bacterium]|nr:ribonuclease Z [Syntrophorhabdaceae bacterium]HQM82496.1 ribonuclease Z [Syntrophorhabdaceae bacterium]
MKLTMLGTGTSMPSLRRGSSSCLLTTKRQKILIDIGPAVVRRLLECGHSVTDIDAVAVTHFHVDHTADLSTFLFACNYGKEVRTKPLTIIGGPGVRRFYSGLNKIYRWVAPKSYNLSIVTMKRDVLQLDGLAIETFPVNHNRESIGIRVQERRAVAFTGDTAHSKSLVKLAAGVDLLVAECSFPFRAMKGHLNLEALDRIVREARPKRVILTHLDPEWDDFKGVLHAPYLLGEDGMTVSF